MVNITDISEVKMMGQSSSSSSSDSEDEIVNRNSIPMCRYGVSCYRKNPQHFQMFRHPPKNVQNLQIPNSVSTVEIHFEIGHKSTPLATKNTDGNTHEWTLFVRGCIGQRIEKFVEKVTFNVGDQFLILTEPPFSVKRLSKSNPFAVPVQLNVKTEERNRIVEIPYKITFNENAALENVQREKIVFHNASSQFRQILINGGATVTQEHSIDVAAAPEASTSGSNKRKRSDSATKEGDEFEAFGIFCANKLRNINSDFKRQKGIAQKLISEVLYYAEMNTLTPETRISALKRIDRGSSRESGSEVSEPPEIKVEPSDNVVNLADNVKTEPVDEEEQQEVVSSVGDVA